MKKRFKWPQYPRDITEFEAFMKAADTAMAQRGFTPPQRSIELARLLGEAFRWCGEVFPSLELLRQPGFVGTVLLAKGQAWLREMYPHRPHQTGALATIPVRLGQTLWKLRLPAVYGRLAVFVDPDLSNKGVRMAVGGATVSMNLLCLVEDLSPGVATRLSANEQRQFQELADTAIHAALWWLDLPAGEMSQIARSDYESSTAELLAGRYPQAAWAAQQAAEKLIKSLHEAAGLPFLRGGVEGHNIEKLGADFKDKFDIELPREALKATNWNPNGRYKATSATEESALKANHAVIELVTSLRTSAVREKLEAFQHSTA